jgi:hypothetical protein
MRGRSAADAQPDAHIPFGIDGAWALVSAVYVGISGARKGRAIIGAARHRLA